MSVFNFVISATADTSVIAFDGNSMTITKNTEEKYVRVNDYVYNYDNFSKFLDERISDSNYVIADYIDLDLKNTGIEEKTDHYIKLWIANDIAERPVILSSLICSGVLFIGISSREL